MFLDDEMKNNWLMAKEKVPETFDDHHIDELVTRSRLLE
jgi:hypothetical protein